MPRIPGRGTKVGIPLPPMSVSISSRRYALLQASSDREPARFPQNFRKGNRIH